MTLLQFLSLRGQQTFSSPPWVPVPHFSPLCWRLLVRKLSQWTSCYICFVERQKNLLFKAVNLAFSQVLKFTPLHFLLDPCYIRWAKVSTLLIFAVVLHLTPFGIVPMHISTLHLWRLKAALYPFLCGSEWQSIRESFLTVKFIRQESKVLWGKCWNKTPSEEVLEGIKYYGGRCNVMILQWKELSSFLKLLFIPKNRAENWESLLNSSGGLLCHCVIWHFSLIKYMLYLKSLRILFTPSKKGDIWVIKASGSLFKNLCRHE